MPSTQQLLGIQRLLKTVQARVEHAASEKEEDYEGIDESCSSNDGNRREEQDEENDRMMSVVRHVIDHAPNDDSTHHQLKLIQMIMTLWWQQKYGDDISIPSVIHACRSGLNDGGDDDDDDGTIDDQLTTMMADHDSVSTITEAVKFQLNKSLETQGVMTVAEEAIEYTFGETEAAMAKMRDQSILHDDQSTVTTLEVLQSKLEDVQTDEKSMHTFMETTLQQLNTPWEAVMENIFCMSKFPFEAKPTAHKKITKESNQRQSQNRKAISTSQHDSSSSLFPSEPSMIHAISDGSEADIEDSTHETSFDGPENEQDDDEDGDNDHSFHTFSTLGTTEEHQQRSDGLWETLSSQSDYDDDVSEYISECSDEDEEDQTYGDDYHECSYSVDTASQVYYSTEVIRRPTHHDQPAHKSMDTALNFSTEAAWDRLEHTLEDLQQTRRHCPSDNHHGGQNGQSGEGSNSDESVVAQDTETNHFINTSLNTTMEFSTEVAWDRLEHTLEELQRCKGLKSNAEQRPGIDNNNNNNESMLSASATANHILDKSLNSTMEFSTEGAWDRLEHTLEDPQVTTRQQKQQKSSSSVGKAWKTSSTVYKISGSMSFAQSSFPSSITNSPRSAKAQNEISKRRRLAKAASRLRTESTIDTEKETEATHDDSLNKSQEERIKFKENSLPSCCMRMNGVASPRQQTKERLGAVSTDTDLSIEKSNQSFQQKLDCSSSLGGIVPSQPKPNGSDSAAGAATSNTPLLRRALSEVKNRNGNDESLMNLSNEVQVNEVLSECNEEKDTLAAIEQGVERFLAPPSNENDNMKTCTDLMENEKVAEEMERGKDAEGGVEVQLDEERSPANGLVSRWSRRTTSNGNPHQRVQSMDSFSKWKSLRAKLALKKKPLGRQASEAETGQSAMTPQTLCKPTASKTQTQISETVSEPNTLQSRIAPMKSFKELRIRFEPPFDRTLRMQRTPTNARASSVQCGMTPNSHGVAENQQHRELNASLTSESTAVSSLGMVSTESADLPSGTKGSREGPMENSGTTESLRSNGIASDGTDAGVSGPGICAPNLSDREAKEIEVTATPEDKRSDGAVPVVYHDARGKSRLRERRRAQKKKQKIASQNLTKNQSSTRHELLSVGKILDPNEAFKVLVTKPEHGQRKEPFDLIDETLEKRLRGKASLQETKTSKESLSRRDQRKLALWRLHRGRKQKGDCQVQPIQLSSPHKKNVSEGPSLSASKDSVLNGVLSSTVCRDSSAGSIEIDVCPNKTPPRSNRFAGRRLSAKRNKGTADSPVALSAASSRTSGSNTLSNSANFQPKELFPSISALNEDSVRSEPLQQAVRSKSAAGLVEVPSTPHYYTLATGVSAHITPPRRVRNKMQNRLSFQSKSPKGMKKDSPTSVVDFSPQWCKGGEALDVFHGDSHPSFSFF